MLLNDTPYFTLPSGQFSPDERRIFHYEKGDEIPLLNQGVWEVIKGYVYLETVNSQGEEVFLGWVSPSSVLGMYLTSQQTTSAKALSEVYLRWYSFGEVQTNPALANWLFTHILRRIQQTQDLLFIVKLSRIEERLEQLLLLLKKDFGETVEKGVRLNFRLTHHQLANAVNTSRVTITKLLADFQNKGLIEFDVDRHLVVKF